MRSSHWTYQVMVASTLQSSSRFASASGVRSVPSLPFYHLWNTTLFGGETQENIKFNFQPLLHLSHHALPCYFHLGKEVGGKNGEIQNTICIIHKYNLYTCRLLKDQPQPSSCVSSLFFSPALLYWRCQYFSITIITEIVINITIVILTSFFVFKVPVLPSSPQ